MHGPIHHESTYAIVEETREIWEGSKGFVTNTALFLERCAVRAQAPTESLRET
jgi:hypothetical protein